MFFLQVFLLLIGLPCFPLGQTAGKKQPPNIIFIVGDDLGRADIGFTEGNHQTPTPHIDKLAYEGIILNRHYTGVACTRTRSSLMTGKYTFNTGIQNTVLAMGQPYGLPLSFTTVPQHLKNLNYTHHLAVWEAQIQALDEQVERIYAALKSKGILKNTIIIFASDNGPMTRMARVLGLRGINFGSNYPLRLLKTTFFEGGIRNAAFIWSPLLKHAGFVSNQLFDITDWLPTLYEVGGGNVTDLGAIDGVSQWQSLKHGTGVSSRREIAHSIDTVQNMSAISWVDDSGYQWKLVQGLLGGLKNYTGWERTIGTSAANPMATPTVASINCNAPWGVEQTPCRPWIADCLFDVTADPCELNNVAQNHTDIVALLQGKRAAYLAAAPPALYNGTFDPVSNPALWDNWWVPWQDPVPVLAVNDALCGQFNPYTKY